MHPDVYEEMEGDFGIWCLKQLSRIGDLFATYLLGRRYFAGDGVVQSYESALYCFEKILKFGLVLWLFAEKMLMRQKKRADSPIRPK